jgi:DNA-binding MarR family transcriptional regulator
MHAPPSALDSHLGYWLRLVSNDVSQAFARKLEGQDVTVAEWVALRELYDAGTMAPSRLAARHAKPRGAITKLADRLIARALARRAADPGDGRAQTLALTPQGRKFVPALAALADRNDAECFEHMTAHDRRTLARLLRQIAGQRGLTIAPID